MTALKCGDRAIAYSGYAKHQGEVESIDSDGMIKLTGLGGRFHRKQLRKLKPRKPKAESKPREWNCIVGKDGLILEGWFKHEPISCDKGLKIIPVVEILPGSAVLKWEDFAAAWDNLGSQDPHEESYDFKVLCQNLNLPSPKDKE